MELKQALDILREEQGKCMKLSKFEPDPLKRPEDGKRVQAYQIIIDFVEHHTSTL